MKVLYIANDDHFSHSLQSFIENKGISFEHKRLDHTPILTGSLNDSQLIIFECSEELLNMELMIKQMLSTSINPISIIIISDQIDFLAKTHLYDLGIMTVMRKTGFSFGRLNKYLDTISQEIETIKTLSELNIAVIDDSRFSLEIIKAFFLKYNITKVAYYQNAADFMNQNFMYDLYLVDLVMPDYDGEDIIYNIREYNHNAIVILITTYGEGKAISHCLAIGADDFILKPLDFKLFMLRIHTCLTHYRITQDNNKKAEKLYELATRDALTGVYNRSFYIESFNKKAQESLRNNRPFSLILLDLDYFKQINDEYGHLMGDEVLKSVSKLLKSHLRETDLICRWGGEEFSILLLDTDLKSASFVAEKLRTQIELLRVESNINLTSSFGVTQWREDDTEESVFKRVDNSLYLAKLTGRNKVVTDEELYINASGLPINIEWGPFFRSGHPKIDDEHFALIRLSNEIIVNCFRPGTEEETLKQFDKLMVHIVAHFDSEEEILAQHHYSQLEEHKQIHRELVTKAKTIENELHNQSISVLTVAKYLIQDVVVGHIIKSDFDFFSLFQN